MFNYKTKKALKDVIQCFICKQGDIQTEIADKQPETFLRANSTFSSNVIQTFTKLFVDDKEKVSDGIFGLLIDASFLKKRIQTKSTASIFEMVLSIDSITLKKYANANLKALFSTKFWHIVSKYTL